MLGFAEIRSASLSEKESEALNSLAVIKIIFGKPEKLTANGRCDMRKWPRLC